MKLIIEPNEEGQNDTARVTTANTELVCDDGHITIDGNLKLGFAAMTLMEVKIGDREVAQRAHNAVRRAIRYDETWECEVDE